MEKKEYVFTRPVVINGIEKLSVEYRRLNVGDLRQLSRVRGDDDAARMIARACGISPEDVGGMGTRDFVTLKGLILDEQGDAEIEVFEPDDMGEITVCIEGIESDAGVVIDRVVVHELTSSQSMQAEKVARGNEFELIFCRVRESCGMSSLDLEKMTMSDFRRVGAAVSVFFTPIDGR